MNERLNKILSFLEEIEKFKLIERIPYLSDRQTREDDAQHTWYVAMMLLVLEKEFKGKFDLLRTFKIIMVHDLVEIYTGDDWVVTKEEKEKKRFAETKAAQKLFKLLPKDLGTELHSLWEEYDEGETVEAKIAKGLDKLSYTLQYNISDKIHWFKEGGLSEDEKNYAKPYLQADPLLAEIMVILLSERN